MAFAHWSRVSKDSRMIRPLSEGGRPGVTARFRSAISVLSASDGWTSNESMSCGVVSCWDGEATEFCWALLLELTLLEVKKSAVTEHATMLVTTIRMTRDLIALLCELAMASFRICVRFPISTMCNPPLLNEAVKLFHAPISSALRQVCFAYSRIPPKSAYWRNVAFCLKPLRLEG